MLHHKNRYNQSFTLIELLIVIAIIAILAAVIIASTGNARKNARDVRRTQDLDALKTALEFYYDDHKKYPQGNIGPGGASSDTGFCIEKATEANQFQDLLVSGNYVSTVPKDPLFKDVADPDYCYWYQTKDNGQKFKFFAKAENQDFEPAIKDGGLYANYYEAYSINAGSNLIAFTGEGGGGGGGFLPCPQGYVLVANNPNITTDDEYYTRIGKQSFCVMKYEAKYNCTGDGDGDIASACSAPADSGAGLDWRDTAKDPNKVVSTANGAPIVHITHTEALAACPTDSHLITNDEWMAIARNAEQVNSNWSGNSVGTGCLYRGNSGESSACGYNGADPEQGTSRDAKAKLTLHNGSEIWDISGNVWEHVKNGPSDTLISLQDNPEATTNGTTPITDSGFQWSDFASGSLSRYLLNNGDLNHDGYSNSIDYDMFRPSNSSWNANQGVGRIYHYSNSSTNTQSYVFLRGGNWSDGANDGAFTLNLYWGTGNQYYYVGFRCAR